MVYLANYYVPVSQVPGRQHVICQISTQFCEFAPATFGAMHYLLLDEQQWNSQ